MAWRNDVLNAMPAQKSVRAARGRLLLRRFEQKLKLSTVLASFEDYK